MSAAVSTIQHQPGTGSQSASRMETNPPADNKRHIIKTEESTRPPPPAAPLQASVIPSGSKSERKNSTNPPQHENNSDYFSLPRPSRLDQEPNPFEQSFATGGASTNNGDPLATPKAILPPVTSMTSPAGYNWGPNSLRSGPLSPAMLQGPTNPPSNLGFDSHLRTGLTPNESCIRSTPGGSLFPATSSPGFLFPTPGTMEFQKTAISAAHMSNTQSSLLRSQTPDLKAEDNATQEQKKPRQISDPYDAHNAHNAASGLYLLAQMGGAPNTYQSQNSHMASSIQPNVTTMESSPNLARRVAVNNAHSAVRSAPPRPPPQPSNVRGASEGSNDRSVSSQEPETSTSPNGRKGKNTKVKGSSTGKRKSEGSSDNSKTMSSKKFKNSRSAMSGSDDGEPDLEDYEDDGQNEIRKDGKKMTDEEKRKNFLERNRVAALKCRQRKKQWLANLQAKVEMYGTENDALNATVQSLREEIVSLKTLLLAHKDCSVARANGVQLDIATLATSASNDYGHVSMIQPYSGMMSSVMHQQNPAERRFS